MTNSNCERPKLRLARIERANPAVIDQSSNLVPAASAQRVATKTPFAL
jgi:hypothetical protein